MRAIDDAACRTRGCDNFGQPGVNIVCHGWFNTESGRRRRYRCKRCGATLSTNTGTAYSGLRCSRKAFDNLTIRQGSAYLRRRSTSHARDEDPLHEHVELFRCSYNFVRPHRALRFGREARTPAMQAGLASQPLTWSHIFTAGGPSPCLFEAVRISVSVRPTELDAAELPTIFWPHEHRKAA